MEFKYFNEFYSNACNLANELMLVNKNNIDAIEKLHSSYDKNIRYNYFIMGQLTYNAKSILKSNSDLVKFSFESLVKNIINHGDLKFFDYKIIKFILENPNKIRKSKNNNENIILFFQNDEYYMLVIKTTKDKNENFIKSFRKMGKKEFETY